jgi:DNA modification methylase
MLPSNSIDLVYIDPPFFSGTTYNVLFGDQNEIRSFSDIWEGGIPGYLIWLNARILEIKRILKNTGVFVIHLDYHASHYVKQELDKIFGSENFENEIIWKRTSAHNDPKRFGSIHDSLFVYSKTNSHKWNRTLVPHDKKYIEDFYRYVEPKTNRRYTSGDLSGGGPGPARKFGDKIIQPPKGRHWAHDQAGIDELMRDNRIIFTKNSIPRFKRYLDEMTEGQPLQDIWTDIGPVASMAKERIGYPTQKPEALLERIIKSYTNEDDVVADFFVGGGTTVAVAQKLNRRWIACDQSRVAVAITQGRLESLYEKAK